MLILVYPTKAQVSPKSENLFLLKCIFSYHWRKMPNLITKCRVKHTETKHLIHKYTIRLNFHIVKPHYKKNTYFFPLFPTCLCLLSAILIYYKFYYTSFYQV